MCIAYICCDFEIRQTIVLLVVCFLLSYLMSGAERLAARSGERCSCGSEGILILYCSRNDAD